MLVRALRHRARMELVETSAKCHMPSVTTLLKALSTGRPPPSPKPSRASRNPLSPSWEEGDTRAAANKVLVVACGALAREIGTIVEANRLDHIVLICLPAIWHNRPEKIAPGVRKLIQENRRRYGKIAVAYAECGTQGALDKVCEEEGVERIAGPHCYSFYWGNEAFAQRDENDVDAFFLTDFLARQFESFVIEPLGLDRHPELRDMYFGNYRRLIFLAQTEDADLEKKARGAAERLGLAFEKRVTGMGDLSSFLAAV
jgi:hypothetical protein